MNKQVYITEKERKKCQKVVLAYAELYNKKDMIVLDGGKYGFVKLQYYNSQNEFDNNTTFTDSNKLFEDLWEEWLHMCLLSLAKGTPMAEMEYDEIFQCLPAEMQEKLRKKKRYFERRAGKITCRIGRVSPFKGRERSGYKLGTRIFKLYKRRIKTNQNDTILKRKSM